VSTLPLGMSTAWIAAASSASYLDKVHAQGMGLGHGRRVTLILVRNRRFHLFFHPLRHPRESCPAFAAAAACTQ